jgi:hypothetical protein
MHYNIKEVEKEYYPTYKYSEVERELHPCPPGMGLSKDAYFKTLNPAKKTIVRDFLDLGGNKEALHIVQEKHSDKYSKSTIYDIVTTYKLYGA